MSELKEVLRVYEVQSPAEVKTPKNIELVIVDNNNKHTESIINYSKPKKIKKPRVIEVEVVNKIQKQPELYYNFRPSLKTIPPPDNFTVNNLRYVEPIRNINITRSFEINEQPLKQSNSDDEQNNYKLYSDFDYENQNNDTLLPPKKVKSYHNGTDLRTCSMFPWLIFLTISFLLLEGLIYLFLSQMGFFSSRLIKCQNITKPLTYNEACNKSSDCSASQGLYCPTLTNICNCPLKSDSIFCDCRFGYYWDFKSKKCTRKKRESAACEENYECDITRNLECINNECTCAFSGESLWFNNKCFTCPSGWIFNDDACYYLHDQMLNWDDADTFCKSKGAELVKIDDQDEFDYLVDTFDLDMKNENIWVGAISLVLWDFRWIIDDTKLDRGNKWWCPGEPDNEGKPGNAIREGCVVMGFTNKARKCLRDDYCKLTYTFICEKMP